jgi:hypothetical protein
MCCYSTVMLGACVWGGGVAGPVAGVVSTEQPGVACFVMLPVQCASDDHSTTCSACVCLRHPSITQALLCVSFRGLKSTYDNFSHGRWLDVGYARWGS